MPSGDEIREWPLDGPCGALPGMIEDAGKALALIYEIGAKLPRECQEQGAISRACVGIEDLLTLLGAAAEDHQHA